MTPPPSPPTPSDEEAVLKRSIAATLAIGAFGVGFGLASGSVAIAFDGMFSVTDASMTALALAVARLLRRRDSARFQLGFWHLEPMVLLFNGALLAALTLYAFVNAAGALLTGGREVEFGWAIGYAAVTVLICLVMFITGRRANRRIGSAFLALDVKGWLMSGLITAALLVAFAAASFLEGGPYAHLARYADPAVLAVLTLVLLPVPLRTVFGALKEVLLVAPADFDREVRRVAEAVVARHGLVEARTYVAKVGRQRVVEMHFVAPPQTRIETIAAQDAVREEIGAALGHAGPDRWLTVSFTGDRKWTD